MMIGLNTEEFTDSLNDIILLVSFMVSKKGQHMVLWLIAYNKCVVCMYTNISAAAGLMCVFY